MIPPPTDPSPTDPAPFPFDPEDVIRTSHYPSLLQHRHGYILRNQLSWYCPELCSPLTKGSSFPSP